MGYAIVDQTGNALRWVTAGVLKAPPGERLERRLAALAAGLRDILRRYQPTTAAVEDVFVRLDPKAALIIGHGRGALLAVLGEAGIEVEAYPPATVKRAVAGNGRAGKEQVARMVTAILGPHPFGPPPGPLPGPLPSPALPTDATDAVAVAVTHALRGNVQTIHDKRVRSDPPSRASPPDLA